VLRLTNRACAIAGLLSPDAAICATRRTQLEALLDP